MLENSEHQPYLQTQTYENNIKCVRQHLRTNKLELDLTDSHRRTPLFYAAQYSRHDIAELLITSGCDPDIPDVDGNSPLHEAAEKCDLRMIRLLTSKGRSTCPLIMTQW